MGNNNVASPCCTDANEKPDIERATAPVFAKREALWPNFQKEGAKPIDVAIKVLGAVLDEKGLPASTKDDIKCSLEAVKNYVEKETRKPTKETDALKAAALHIESETDALDENTKEWLLGSFVTQGGGKKVSIRQIGLTIMAARKLLTLHKGTPLDVAKIFSEFSAQPKLGNELRKMESWQDFNVFKLCEYAGSMQQALVDMSIVVFQVNNLERHFGINHACFLAFAREVSDSYKTEPLYHNAMHAADVVQSFHVLLHQTKGKPFSEMELVSGFTAAIVHDVGHPGVTNSFHVNAQTSLACTYSDQSVNEYMHLATCWRILAKDSNNWMRIFLNDQRNFVKKAMLQIILATDMANHFANIAEFKGIVDSKGRDVTRWEKPIMALEELMHAADVSNPGKSIENANLWTDRVLGEFFAQGDQERELGLPISNLCDRETVSRPGSQVGFVNFVVKPLFVAVKEIANVQGAIENMESYAAMNKDLLEKEKQEKEAAAKSSEKMSLPEKMSNQSTKVDKCRKSMRAATMRQGVNKMEKTWGNPKY